jgi:acyl-coenzyme A synthetase/AMP-(fatty) acid ligase
VEDALCDVSGVLEASVTGLPDNRLGTRPIGCITIAEGTKIDAAAMRRCLQPKLPYDLSSLEIKVVRSFPLTPTGKISKAQLRAQLASMRQ